MSTAEPGQSGYGGGGELPASPSMVSVKTGSGIRTKDVLKAAISSRREAMDHFLKEIDLNKDGDISTDELLALMETVAVQRRQRRWMWFAIVALAFCAVATVGATVGLTYAVLKAVQNTQVIGGVMYVKDSTTDVVRTGSAEFTIVDNIMVSRETLMAALANNTNASGRRSLASANSTGPPPKAVLRTAKYKGTPHAFSSRVSVRVLMELEYLWIKGTGDVEIAIKVDGVARVPMQDSVLGSVVRIITTTGTITLDDTAIHFASTVADIFADAGFRVSGNRRMLLGIYDVLGFFNWIEDLEVFNLPPDEAKPKLPSGDYLMKLKIYEPCISLDNTTYDRCRYEVPEQPSSGAVPPSAPSPPDANDDTGSDGTRRRRQLRTTSRRRELQGNENGFVDLAGVELVDGVRYMTHNETSSMWNGVLRTVYEFALMPTYRKIELLLPGNQMASWQEENLPFGSGSVITPTWCSIDTVPADIVSKARMDGNSLRSFEYLGVDSKYDRSARHFRLTVKQPTDGGNPDLPSSLVINYWDTLSGNTPLAFDLLHPAAGLLLIQVVEFRAIAADSSDTAAALFVAPDQSNCPKAPSIPRLSSAFTVSVFDPAPGTYDGTGAPITAARRRAMLHESATRAQIWDSLDHVNGTGEWPEWALEHYGGVHPAQSSYHGRSLQDRDCSKTTFSARLALPPAAPICELQFSIITSQYLAIEASCSGSLFGSPLKLGGALGMNLCEQKVYGCIKLSVGLEAYVEKSSMIRTVVNTLGVKDLEIASLCAGYDYARNEGFVTATLRLWLVFLKVELSATMRWSSCCMWIEEVKIEAFAGVDFWFYSYWYFLGDYKFVQDFYLKGNTGMKDAARYPSITNIYSSNVSVYEGLWGVWQDMVYCKAVSNVNDGGTVRGQLVTGFRLRLEGQQGDNDDTSLNGLEAQCGTGTTKQMTEGFWGDWRDWGSCPSGTYVTGARMRVQLSQGSGDDTAANSIELKCNNNQAISSHSGWWGGWTSWTSCPSGLFVCGMQVRVEYMQAWGDDTALNGLRLACCTF